MDLPINRTFTGMRAREREGNQQPVAINVNYASVNKPAVFKVFVKNGVCGCADTLRAWSMVKNDGIIDFLREYLSCHRRSAFTLGSDATKNYTRRHTQV